MKPGMEQELHRRNEFGIFDLLSYDCQNCLSLFQEGWSSSSKNIKILSPSFPDTLGESLRDQPQTDTESQQICKKGLPKKTSLGSKMGVIVT